MRFVRTLFIALVVASGTVACGGGSASGPGGASGPAPGAVQGLSTPQSVSVVTAK